MLPIKLEIQLISHSFIQALHEYTAKLTQNPLPHTLLSFVMCVLLTWKSHQFILSFVHFIESREKC